jgi:hypothetical protein
MIQRRPAPHGHHNGQQEHLDTWKVAPPMGMMMTMADLLVFLPRHKRGLPAMALTMGVMAAVLAAAVILWA